MMQTAKTGLNKKDFENFKSKCLQIPREDFYLKFRKALVGAENEADFENLTNCNLKQRKEILSQYMVQDLQSYSNEVKDKNIKHDVFLSDIEGNAEEMLRILKINGVITGASYENGKIKLDLNKDFKGRIFFTGDATTSGKGDLRQKGGKLTAENSLIVAELFYELRDKIFDHNDQLKKNNRGKRSENHITFTGVLGNHDFLDGADEWTDFINDGEIENVNGNDYCSDLVNFVRYKTMMIKVTAQMQIDYLQDLLDRDIKEIEDNDLKQLGLLDYNNRITVTDKIDQLKKVIEETEDILTKPDILEQVILVVKDISDGSWDRENSNMFERVLSGNTWLCQPKMTNEKARQLYWTKSGLLHNLIVVGEDQNKSQTRLMHNPVYLLDQKATEAFLEIKRISYTDEYKNLGQSDKDKLKKCCNNFVEQAKLCFKNNKITIPMTFVHRRGAIYHDLSHELQNKGFSEIVKREVWDGLFKKNVAFIGHENVILSDNVLQEINDTNTDCPKGVCVDRVTEDSDSLKKYCAVTVSKDMGDLIQVEQYEPKSTKPKRTGVVFLSKNGMNPDDNKRATELNNKIKETIKETNKELAELTNNDIFTNLKDFIDTNNNHAANSLMFLQRDNEALFKQYTEQILTPIKKIFDKINTYIGERQKYVFNTKIKENNIVTSSILNENLELSIMPNEILDLLGNLKNNKHEYNAIIDSVNNEEACGVQIASIKQYWDNLINSIELNFSNVESIMLKQQESILKENISIKNNTNNNTNNNNVNNNINNNNNNTNNNINNNINNNNTNSTKNNNTVGRLKQNNGTLHTNENIISTDELKKEDNPEELFSKLRKNEEFYNLPEHWPWFRNMINSLIAGDRTINNRRYIDEINQYWKEVTEQKPGFRIFYDDLKKYLLLEHSLQNQAQYRSILLKKLCDFCCLMSIGNNKKYLNQRQAINNYFEGLKGGNLGLRLYFTDHSKRQCSVSRYFDRRKMEFSDIIFQENDNSNVNGYQYIHNRNINNQSNLNNRTDRDILNINDIHWYDALSCSC